MAKLIVYSEDGVQISCDEIDKSFVPGSNFEKQLDGNYVKCLGDRRILPDEVDKDLLEKQKIIEHDADKIIESPSKSNDTRLIPFKNEEEPQKIIEKSITQAKVIEARMSRTMDEVIQSCKSGIYGFVGKMFVMSRLVNLRDGLGFDELKQYRDLAKVVIDEDKNNMLVWIKDRNRKYPDIFLQGAISKKCQN